MATYRKVLVAAALALASVAPLAAAAPASASPGQMTCNSVSTNNVGTICLEEGSSGYTVSFSSGLEYGNVRFALNRYDQNDNYAGTYWDNGAFHTQSSQYNYFHFNTFNFAGAQGCLYAAGGGALICTGELHW
ncbi:hypothetical protein ABH926_003088 [Catenulispora sp. GP43]|uniref:hypothetical protein n=1 Tax=Catenulispora sp. GP43 TaxID=3156263 RepID=UPI0035165DD1